MRISASLLGSTFGFGEEKCRVSGHSRQHEESTHIPLPNAACLRINFTEPMSLAAQIKNKLDPRMEQKKVRKHDPWVTSGGAGYQSYNDSPPSSPPQMRCVKSGLDSWNSGIWPRVLYAIRKWVDLTIYITSAYPELPAPILFPIFTLPPTANLWAWLSCVDMCQHALTGALHVHASSCIYIAGLRLAHTQA